MGTNTINPVKRVVRRYYIELGVALAAYVGVILVRHWLLHGPMRHASESSQIAVALLPMIPVFFLFAAIVRAVVQTDEFCRRVYVDSLALAGGATALLAVTYGLIEGDHLPYLSAWWTYTAFMLAWIVAGFFVRRRYQ